MQERLALITGGNRGLGFEAARQLAHQGHRVILTSRSESEGFAAAQELVAEGLRVEFRPLDVTSGASIDALAFGLLQDGVPLGVLVNNAGVSIRGFTAENVRRTLAVNYFGVARVTDALLPAIPERGTIVMVSSGLGEISNYPAALRKRLLDRSLSRAALDDMVHAFIADVANSRYAQAGWPPSAYNVSKALLNALTRVYARDLAPRRIRVNAVCPGWVRTDMGGRNAPRGVEEGAASIVWAARLENMTTGGFFRDGSPIAW